MTLACGSIGGYPKFSSFGAVVGTRSDAGRDDFLLYHKAAVTVPGPATDRIAEIARESGVFIVSGVIEKDGGTLYCSCVFVSPKDGLVYKRRKVRPSRPESLERSDARAHARSGSVPDPYPQLMPTASERLIWGFGDESTLSVVPVPTAAGEPVPISAAICWENMLPLLRSHFFDQGTQIHCVPTVDGREGWQASMRHIAMEGRCFVLNACQVGRRPLLRPG